MMNFTQGLMQQSRVTTTTQRTSYFVAVVVNAIVMENVGRVAKTKNMKTQNKGAVIIYDRGGD